MSPLCVQQPFTVTNSTLMCHFVLSGHGQCWWKLRVYWRHLFLAQFNKKQKEWRVKFRRPCRQLIGQLWGRSVCGGSVGRCAWVYLSQRGSAAAVLSTQKTTLSNMRGWLALWIWADNYKGRTNKHGGFNIFLVCCCHLSVQPGKKNWGEEKKEITMRCETDGPTSRPKGAPTLSFCLPPLLSFLSRVFTLPSPTSRDPSDRVGYPHLTCYSFFFSWYNLVFARPTWISSPLSIGLVVTRQLLGQSDDVWDDFFFALQFPFENVPTS